jgi:hypothetical protein
VRGSIKRGQTPHNSRALTLPASVYAGKREKAKIIKCEKVRGSKDKYTVFCILEPEVSSNIKWGADALSVRALRLGKSKIGASYRRQRGQVRPGILVPGCGLPASSIRPGSA